MTLAPNLSFTDDSSSNFPIRGEGLDGGRIASDRPTAIFFGTSHCWNTNREAERFVALYEKKKEAARFLIVDLERPSAEQRALVSRFYRGYIPTLAFLDRSGKVVYNDAGETANRRGDFSRLEEILGKAGAAAR
ncbi:MAG: thioredoxin family protein [Acidobacteriota bacterium]|nr:thioredoxin family protein [Acidobacteriota bacterium]